MRRYRIATAIVVVPVRESAGYASTPLAHNRIPGLETFTGKPPYSIWSYSKPSLVRRRPAVGNDSVRWEHAQVRSADPAACPMGSTSGLL
jgi:hypothetical protein